MKKYATIENGVVVNVSLGADDWEPWPGFIEVVEEVCPGWFYDGKEFLPPVPPKPPVPEEVSDRQFFEALAVSGKIAEEEALSAVQTGALPVTIQSFVDGLSPEEKFSTSMFFGGETSFKRADPIAGMLGEIFKMTADQLDDLWRLAAER